MEQRVTTVSVEPEASTADLLVVQRGLRAFNVANVGEPEEQPVNVLLRDVDGLVVGGVVGHIKWKWLYIAKLWVDDAHRGQGAGTRLMDAAEQFARERGATDVSLDTFGYQARPFYERRGYRLFGTLDGFPPGGQQFFLTKSLR